MFADDIVLIGYSANDINKLIKCVLDYCKKWRLEVNISKSKIMIVAKEKIRKKLWKLYSNKDNAESLLLPLTQSYQYLGIWFNDSWNWSTHIKYICKKVDERINSYKFTIFRNKFIENSAKVTVWNVMFKPILLYGSEVWWCNASQNLVLERIQIKVAKWIIGCSDKTCTEVVLRELGLHSLKSQLYRRKLNWLGKINTINNTNIIDSVEYLISKFNGARRSWNSILSSILGEYELKDSLKRLVDTEDFKFNISRWFGVVKTHTFTA